MTSVLTLALLFVAFHCQAAAQSGTIRGTVLDESTKRPVPNAEVMLSTTANRQQHVVASSENGTFVFARLKPAEYRLRVMALGYVDTNTPVVSITASDTIDVVVSLGVKAMPLAPLEVTARSTMTPRHPGLAGFQRRAELRLGGHYLLSEYLEQRRPSQTVDLFMEVPSIRVSLTARTLMNERTRCAPHVYVDGQRLTGSGRAKPGEVYEVLNTIHPADLLGIEVYSGVSTVPAEFSGTGAGCGIIAVWLKR